MDIILWFVTIIGGAIAVFAGYFLLTKFVFNKVVVNKWILLAVAAVLLILGFLVIKNTWMKIAFEAVGIIVLLWFFDVYTTGNPRIKKEKKVVIKAKAKPNRVKNNKK